MSRPSQGISSPSPSAGYASIAFRLGTKLQRVIEYTENRLFAGHLSLVAGIEFTIRIMA
jgi:hypothetical protein